VEKRLGTNSVIPNGGGTQILPIMWRQIEELSVNVKHENCISKAPINLQDLSLGTVPSIRMMVSDVVLDGIFHF
jgi:hypothetical protein